MPEYYPLFDSTSGKPLFNMDGAPVFARVRSGYISCSISVTGTCAATNRYPGGTQTYSFDGIFTRTSWKNFTSNVPPTLDAPYLFIGNDDYWGYPTYVRLRCTDFYMTYVSKTVGWRLTFKPWFFRYSLIDGIYHGNGGCFERFEYFKSDRILIPDGTYDRVPATDAGSYDDGFSLTVPDSVSLVFHET